MLKSSAAFTLEVLKSPIQLKDYQPRHDLAGICIGNGGRLIGDVFETLISQLISNNLLPEGGFNLWFSGNRNFCFPNHTWLSCYVVSGGSNTWYIHIEAITKDKGKRFPLYLGKTYRGMDYAYSVARACAEYLGA